jgi:type IV secretion system protein VirD4
MQTLLSYTGSAVVMDIKGELSAVTARRRITGQKVFILNPFGLLAEHYRERGFETFARFNPLLALDPASPLYFVSVQRIVEALVYESGGDSHWVQSARDLIAARILWLVESCPPEQRTLGNVRAFLTLPAESFLKEIHRMCAEGSARVQQKAIRFLDSENARENSSIVSTARTQTAFLDDPALCASLAASDFQFADLKTERMTIYSISNSEVNI